jgi:hypothetical protein
MLKPKALFAQAFRDQMSSWFAVVANSVSFLKNSGVT